MIRWAWIQCIDELGKADLERYDVLIWLQSESVDQAGQDWLFGRALKKLPLEESKTIRA